MPDWLEKLLIYSFLWSAVCGVLSGLTGSMELGYAAIILIAPIMLVFLVGTLGKIYELVHESIDIIKGRR